MNSLNMFSTQPQVFSLPPAYIDYVLKNNSLSYISFIKLYKTCKYFYQKQQIFFTMAFYHQYDSKYFLHNGSDLKDVKYWFGGKLKLSESWESFPSHQIYRCTIEEFNLSFSNITLNDFLIIVAENTIKDFSLSGGFIKAIDGSNICMDFILTKLPNVEYFIFDNNEISTSYQQLKNIETTNFWKKLKKFFVKIVYSSDFFDPTPLSNFIQNNASSSLTSQIIIDGINSEANYAMLKAFFNDFFKSWNGENQIEIYLKNVPFSVLRERLRKRCAEREELKNKKIKFF